eukprot:UN32051
MHRCSDGKMYTDSEYVLLACLDSNNVSIFNETCSYIKEETEAVDCSNIDTITNGTLAQLCIKEKCCEYRSSCEDLNIEYDFCYCPTDYAGETCEEELDLTCDVEVVSAPVCLVPLDIGGYDPTLDGDPPCHIVDPKGYLNSTMRLNCVLDDSEKRSNIPDGYHIDSNPPPFEY